MKIKYIISAALLSLVASSCSNIAEDERLIYVEPATVNRNVLIEDFTGQRCVNCPKATETIEQLQETYGSEHVIPVAIHCGKFGFAGNAKIVGLMNDEGKEYWNTWFSDTQGQPVAKINRSNTSEEYAQWSTIVAGELQKSTTTSINLSAFVDKESRLLFASGIVEDQAFDFGKLQLWLVESGIVTLQLMPDGSSNSGYVHNHVFRASINGTWGVDMKLTNYQYPFDYKYTVPEGYNLDNLSVIAFVYNENGVKQVVVDDVKDIMTQPVY